MYIDFDKPILSDERNAINMEKNKQRVELHCHSVYSEQDGVSSVRDIIDFAVANGMSAVAITDHASVAGYGEAEFYASKHEDFKMIYGMEAFVVNDLEPSVTGDKKYIKECPSFHVTFLIQNEEGKENLSFTILRIFMMCMLNCRVQKD